MSQYLTAMDDRAVRTRFSNQKQIAVRTGNLYVPVLGTCLVIALLAVALSTVERSRYETSIRREREERARMAAFGGLAIARQQMFEDLNWRERSESGRLQWTIDLPQGKCALNVFDPSDGDLLDSSNDPYVIEATGVVDDCRFRLSSTFVERREIPGGIAAGVAAGGSLSLSSATVRGNADVISNGSLFATNSLIETRASAAGLLAGRSFLDRTAEGIEPIDLPDPASVFGVLAARATPIDPERTEVESSNLITNGGLEGNSREPWRSATQSEATCSLNISRSDPRSGTGSLQVSERSGPSAGPVHSLHSFARSGATYRITVWVRGTNESQDFRLVARWRGESAPHDTMITGDFVNCGTSWTRVALSFTPTWADSLESCDVRIESRSTQSCEDFYIDDVEVVEVRSEYRLSRVLLSGASNPFGESNAEGIYLLDCRGNRLTIEDSRIVGTLLIKDPGPDSKLGPGGLVWSPHSPDLPNLVVWRTAATEGQVFRFEPSGTLLSEPKLGTNFNPSGTPSSDGSVDDDLRDVYETKFSGAMLIDGDVVWNGQAILEEPLIATGSISVSGSLSLEPQRRLERLRPEWLGGTPRTFIVGSGPHPSAH